MQIILQLLIPQYVDLGPAQCAGLFLQNQNENPPNIEQTVDALHKICEKNLEFLHPYSKMYFVYLCIYCGLLCFPIIHSVGTVMVNVLFVLSDELKIERFKTVFKSDARYSFTFFSTSSAAVDYISETAVDIAVISIGLNVVSGAELAQMLFDNSTKCIFVFEYRPDELSDALWLFNMYDHSRLIECSQAETENIRDILEDCTQLITREERHKTQNELFREKEKAYKRSMAEMSSILNSRISCYTGVIDMVINSSELLFDSDDDFSEVRLFFKNQFASYVQLFLDRRIDFDAYIEGLKDRLNIPEAYKFFQLNNNVEFAEDELFYNMTFLITLICTSFENYMNGYRGKVDISESERALRVDIIYEVRAGESQMRKWRHTRRIIDETLPVFCERFETAAKNGIVQYRLHFKKNNISGEASA